MARGAVSVRTRRQGDRRAGATKRHPLAGVPIYVRALLGVTAALVLALLAGTLNEARIAAGLRQQASQTATANARLREDIAATARQVTVAESDASVIRAAHRLGYFLPGEPWIVTVPAPVTPTAP